MPKTLLISPNSNSWKIRYYLISAETAFCNLRSAVILNFCALRLQFALKSSTPLGNTVHFRLVVQGFNIWLSSYENYYY